MPHLPASVRRAAALKAADDIIATAKDQDRDLTADEVVAVNAHIADVDAIDAEREAEKSRDVFAKFTVPPGVLVPASADSFSRPGATTKALTALHAAARAGQSASVYVDRKAFVAYTLPPLSLPGLVGGDYPRTSPRLLDLFAQQRADGPSVRVYKTNAIATADTISEGDVKPDAGLTLTYQDVALVKIANSLKISDEMTEDAPSFVGAIQSEMSRGVLTEENTYAVTTILASGLGTDTAADAIDGTADAIATLQATYGVLADAIVMNPSDLATVRKAKASTGGEYHVDPLTNAPASLHGVPIVTTTGLDVGDVLVGSFRTAGIAFTRSALRVDVGLDTDDFTRNLRTLRCEERVALGVTRPLHMVLLTIGLES